MPQPAPGRPSADAVAPPAMPGLSSRDAREALASCGPNALPERRPEPPWKRLARQFASPLVYILLVALGIDLALWMLEGRHG